MQTRTFLNSWQRHPGFCAGWLIALTTSLCVWQIEVHGDDPVDKKKEAQEAAPKVGKPAAPRLSKKQPFTFVPDLRPGSQVIAMHSVQFETKEGGEPILARVYLTLVNPPPLPGKKHPARIFGMGVEVEAPERPPGEQFVPDFYVDKRFVDKVPKSSAYMLNLGDVKYRVNTTREP